MRPIYIVMSRDDSDFLFVTFNEGKAVQAKDEQIKKEEMAGGRPSVYIKITKVQ